jgi:hypothetical protein
VHLVGSYTLSNTTAEHYLKQQNLGKRFEDGSS